MWVCACRCRCWLATFACVCVCMCVKVTNCSSSWSRFLCELRTLHNVNKGGRQAGWLWRNDNTLRGANTRWTCVKGSASDLMGRGPNEADSCVILTIAMQYVFRWPQHRRRHFGIGRRTRSLVFHGFSSSSQRWELKRKRDYFSPFFSSSFRACTLFCLSVFHTYSLSLFMYEYAELPT